MDVWQVYYFLQDKTPAKNQSQSAGSKTIFVGNLSYSVDREQV
jgi:nucleolin